MSRIVVPIWALLMACDNPAPPNQPPQTGPKSPAPSKALWEFAPSQYAWGGEGVNRVRAGKVLFDNGSDRCIKVFLSPEVVKPLEAGRHMIVFVDAGRFEFEVLGEGETAGRKFFPTLQEFKTYVFNYGAIRSYRLERKHYSITGSVPSGGMPTVHEERGQEWFETRWPVDFWFEPFPDSVKMIAQGAVWKTRIVR